MVTLGSQLVEVCRDMLSDRLVGHMTLRFLGETGYPESLPGSQSS